MWWKNLNNWKVGKAPDDGKCIIHFYTIEKEKIKVSPAYIQCINASWRVTADSAKMFYKINGSRCDLCISRPIDLIKAACRSWHY